MVIDLCDCVQKEKKLFKKLKQISVKVNAPKIQLKFKLTKIKINLKLFLCNKEPK